MKARVEKDRSIVIKYDSQSLRSLARWIAGIGVVTVVLFLTMNYSWMFTVWVFAVFMSAMTWLVIPKSRTRTLRAMKLAPITFAGVGAVALSVIFVGSSKQKVIDLYQSSRELVLSVLEENRHPRQLQDYPSPIGQSNHVAPQLSSGQPQLQRHRLTPQ